MQTSKSANVLSTTKPDGTRVQYHLFREFEIHYNQMPPGVIQPWHHHVRVEESIYLLEGELWFHWLSPAGRQSTLLQSGDVVAVEKDTHTLETPEHAGAVFIVLRIVPTGVDHRELFRTDKVLDGVE